MLLAARRGGQARRATSTISPRHSTALERRFDQQVPGGPRAGSADARRTRTRHPPSEPPSPTGRPRRAGRRASGRVRSDRRPTAAARVRVLGHDRRARPGAAAGPAGGVRRSRPTGLARRRRRVPRVAAARRRRDARGRGHRAGDQPDIRATRCWSASTRNCWPSCAGATFRSPPAARRCAVSGSGPTPRPVSRVDDMFGVANWADSDDLGDPAHRPPELSRTRPGDRGPRTAVPALPGDAGVPAPARTSAALRTSTSTRARRARDPPDVPGPDRRRRHLLRVQRLRPGPDRLDWLVFEEPPAGYRFANDVRRSRHAGRLGGQPRSPGRCGCSSAATGSSRDQSDGRP